MIDGEPLTQKFVWFTDSETNWMHREELRGKMQDTRYEPDLALAKADKEKVLPLFGSAQSLSERELICTAASLSQQAHGDSDPLRRAIDIVLASAMIAVLSPVLLLVSFAIIVFDPGPIFFAHERLGKDCSPFSCLKFRTMRTNADEILRKVLDSDPMICLEWSKKQKLQDDPRVTWLGRFLRRSCLDELPQLFNVIKGEMSLVGPRPITQTEAHRYGRYLMSYLHVRPGLTGLWQVTRSSKTSYRRRVATDVLYVREQSLRLDLKIMLLTIPAVLTGRGAF